MLARQLLTRQARQVPLHSRRIAVVTASRGLLQSAAQSKLIPCKFINTPSSLLRIARREYSVKAENATATFGTPGNSEGSQVVQQAEAPRPSLESITTLRGKVDYKVYKSLAEKPFNFKTLSAVQSEVLGLLPELAAPTARGAPARDSSDNDGQDSLTIKSDRPIATDLLVKAKTGTGKTLAFLIPAMQARLNDIAEEERRFRAANPSVDKNTVSRHMATYEKMTVGTVILSPTRELATQIATESVRLQHNLKGWETRLFIGGASKNMQLRQFRYNRRDILVATPGRMIDMLDDPEIRAAVGNAKLLVLDEADTLLDMGFKDDIARIVEQMPLKTERQTFMFSATVSREIREIAKRTLRKEHTFIDCVPANESNTHAHIPQYHTVVPSSDQQIPHVFRLLAQDALQHPDGSKVIIFLPTTKMTELFTRILFQMKEDLPFGDRGTKVFEMHSKKAQATRDNTADRFRRSQGGQNILVTSDVSARGVDYPGVTRVIQVGIPSSKDSYVHRVGRTGRAGKAGRGDIVLLPVEKNYISYQLQDLNLQPVTTEKLQQEVEELAAKVDADPKQNSPNKFPVASQRHDRQSRYDHRTITFQRSVQPRIAAIEETLREKVLPSLSDLDVTEAFGSQLGFYVGNAYDMGVDRMDVVRGLQEWAVGALGLKKEPHVSDMFLKKLGVRDNRRVSKGKMLPGRRFSDQQRRREDYQFLGEHRGFERRSFDRRDGSSRRPSYDRRDGSGFRPRSSYGGSSSSNYDRPDFRSNSRSEGGLPF